MGTERLLWIVCVFVILVASHARRVDRDAVSHFSVNYKEQRPKDAEFHPEQQPKDVDIHPEQRPKDAEFHPEQRPKDAEFHPEQLPNYEQPKDTKVTFAFAKHFQSHMVLQQAPQRANIYGFSPDIGADVVIQLNTSGKFYNYTAVVRPSNSSGVGVWTVTLDPVKSNDPVSISAESNGQTLQLEDVLYGDVWVCSGQSNMEFAIYKIFDASEVIANSTGYPNVRFMDVYRTYSFVPLDDIFIGQSWTSPIIMSVADFSAVCWLYGIALNKVLGYAIGLVGTDYGGSPVAAWSSPAALAKCGIDDTEVSIARSQHRLETLDDPLFDGPGNNSVLWNAMVHPLLGMTIYGVIWYQGEGDSEPPELTNRYNCTFPAMIDDWRLKFSAASFGQTNVMFPFGFVQLATSMPPYNPGFTDIRWHQTADYGYVPNKRLQNTFMAVALDLPDFDSNSGPVHTRYKLEVGFRLSLSGLAVAYNKQEVYQGPFPLSARIVSNTSLLVDYGSQWVIDVRNTEGFEVLCSSGNHSIYTWWLPTSIIQSSDTQVTLLASVCGEGQQILGLRYSWQTTPCALKTCAIYSTINALPAPPFVAYADSFAGMPVFKFCK